MTSDFPEKRLADLVHIQQGKWLPAKDQTGGNSPAFGANGVTGYTTKGHYEHPVVALGCRGSCGTLHMAPPGAWIGNNAMALWPLPAREVTTEFLRYTLEHKGTAAVTKQTAQPMISKSDLSGLTIPVPTPEEQRRIVDVMEVAEIHVRSQQEVVEAAEGARVALLIDSIGNLTHALALSDIAKSQLGKMLNTAQQTGQGTRQYLRSINIPEWGAVDLTSLNSMDFTDTEVAKFTLAPGDLLVVEGGAAGRCALYDGPVGLGYQNALHRVRANHNVTSNAYLRYAIEFLHRTGEVDKLCTTTTIKHLSASKFRTLPIPLPETLAKQERIVELLDAAQSVVLASKHRLAHATAARGQLLRDLLSGNHHIPETYDAYMAKRDAA